MNRHPFHLKQTPTLSILAGLAVFQVDTYDANSSVLMMSTGALGCRLK